MKETPKGKFTTVDEYLAAQPRSAKVMLKELRTTIKKAAPQAEEGISYNIPCFKLQGLLVWYAGFKEHVGFYPRASAIEAFKKQLSVYKGAKGSVQFPFAQALPVDLITKIVKYRIKENAEAAHMRAAKKKSPKP